MVRFVDDSMKAPQISSGVQHRLVIMECEICGKKEAVCFVYLEGAKMNSCSQCARGGKVLHYFESGEESVPIISQKTRSEEEIAEGYGKIIKDARTRLGLAIADLGLKIAEKANYLEHVEKEDMLPSIQLARKLEKFLKVRLVESGKSVQSEVKLGSGKKELTLLDVAEIEQKEGKRKK